MRYLIYGVLLAIVMATVGIYAASISGTNKTLGGTGSVAVTAPASSATVAWTTNSSNNVSSVDVTWTPAANANYTVKVVVGSSYGTATVTGSGTDPRTDSVTLSAPVGADAVTAATVVISQN